MDKKILSLSLILILLILLTATYVVINQPSLDEDTDDGVFDTSITDEDLNSEIGNSFLEEDDEIEIGEMV